MSLLLLYIAQQENFDGFIITLTFVMMSMTVNIYGFSKSKIS